MRHYVGFSQIGSHMVCYYCDIFDYIPPPHLATPSQPAWSQRPLSMGISHQYGSYRSPAQVSAVTMSLIVSCDLLPLAVIQVVS